MSKNSLITFEGYFLSVSIDTPHYLSEFVEYPIKVNYGANESLPGENYVIVRRYSDFDVMKKSLKGINFLEKFPPKKYLNKFDMTVVNERQVQLEKFLKCLISMPIIGKSLPVTQFLQKSDQFLDCTKHGFQQVSLDLRCETNWQIQKQITEMGCRVKKCYVSVTNLSNPNKYILSWIDYGPEFLSVNLKQTQKFLKSLSSMKHECIYPISQVILSENGASFIRPLSELGSLHDYMFKSKPLNSIINKYSNTTSFTNCTLINQLSMFGRQILIGLKYLHDKGIPYGHLNLRNVLMLTEQKCALSDIENTVMGLIPQDRQYYVGILKKLTFQEIDIYCFGRLVYEMTFGQQLTSTYIENDNLITWPSQSIRDFLFSVLTESILTNGFPTIDALLNLTLFTSYSSRPIDKTSFKISAPTKEFLDSIQLYSIKLLTSDQKLVKAQRRKVEADAIGVKKKQQRQKESRTKAIKSASYGLGDIDITSDSAAGSDSNTVNTTTVTTNSSSKGPTSVAPPAPPPPPPPTAVTPAQSSDSAAGKERNHLLNSINNFSKMNLKKVQTNDRSTPKV